MSGALFKILNSSFYPSVICEILWGLVFINPYSNAFGITTTPGVYAPMISISDSEVFWGGSYLIIAVTALILFHSQNLLIKKIAYLLITFTLLSKAMLFFLGGGINPGSTTYGTLAMFNLLNFITFDKQHLRERSG